MNTTYNYFVVACAVSLVMSGCSEATLSELNIEKPGSTQVVHATSSIGADTRLEVIEGLNGLDFQWNSSDNFSVINGQQVTPFTLKNGAGSSLAEFEGHPVLPYIAGETLYAIFAPGTDSKPLDIDSVGNVRLSLGEQTGELSDRYQYMYAESKYDAITSSVGFNFHHLVSVIKLNASLPEDVEKIDKLTVFDNQHIFDRGTLVLNSPVQGPYFPVQKGQLYVDKTNDNGSYSGCKITVKDRPVFNGESTSYIYVMPSITYSFNTTNEFGHETGMFESSLQLQPTIIAHANGRILTSPSMFDNYRDVQCGKLYELNVDMQYVAELSAGEQPDVETHKVYAFRAPYSGYFGFEGLNVRLVGPYNNQEYGYYLESGEDILFYFEDIWNSPRIKFFKESNIQVGDKLKDVGLYVFTPQETGYYFMTDGAQGGWKDISQNGPYAYLESGKKYAYSIYYSFENEASLLKADVLDNAEMGTDYTLSSDCNVVTFTPDASGMYSVNSNLSLYWANAEDSERYERVRELSAGTSYTFFLTNYQNVSDSDTKTFSISPLVSITLGDAITSPGTYAFTPSESGYYTINNCNGWWLSTSGIDHCFEAGKTYYYRCESLSSGEDQPAILIKAAEINITTIDTQFTLTSNFMFVTFTPDHSGRYGCCVDGSVMWLDFENSPWNQIQQLEQGQSYRIIIDRSSGGYVNSSAFITEVKEISCGVLMTAPGIYSVVPTESGYYANLNNGYWFNMENNSVSYYLSSGTEYLYRLNDVPVNGAVIAKIEDVSGAGSYRLDCSKVLRLNLPEGWFVIDSKGNDFNIRPENNNPGGYEVNEQNGYYFSNGSIFYIVTSSQEAFDLKIQAQ